MPPKVPLILQPGRADCGPTCLAMVLGAHGRATCAHEVRDALGGGDAPTSAAAMLAAAGHFGLAGRLLQVQAAELGSITRPAVLLLDRSHWVVLAALDARGAVIHDPLCGRHRLSPGELAARFDGVTLALAPGPGFARRADRQTARHQLTRRLLAHPERLAGITLTVLGAQLLGLALPLALARLVDDVLPQRSVGQLEAMAVLLLGLALTQTVLALARQWQQARLATVLEGRVSTDLLTRILNLPVSYVERRSSGELLERAQGGSAAREVLTGAATSVLADGLSAALLLLLLLSRSPLLAAIAGAICGLQLAGHLAASRLVRPLLQTEIGPAARLQSRLLELLRGAPTLVALGREVDALARWRDDQRQLLALSERRQWRAALAAAAGGAVQSLAPLALLLAGGWQVLAGQSRLGAMLGSNALCLALLAPATALFATAQRLWAAGPRLGRLDELFELAPRPTGAQGLPPGPPALSLRRVSARYAELGPWVLREVDLTIRPGETVAVVGPSGSGKSTLLKLLAGLLAPAWGRVEVGGVPLDSLDPRWRRGLGISLQETVLFADSVRANLTLGDASVSDDDLHDALRLAGLEAELAAWPGGLDTVLAEGGVNLSGGQRQRLALARALARRPALLLLDEPFSQLDPVSERLIAERLQSIHATKLLVLHRLAAAFAADRVLVVVGGRVVEQGTPAALLAAGGVFAELAACAEPGSLPNPATRSHRRSVGYSAAFPTPLPTAALADAIGAGAAPPFPSRKETLHVATRVDHPRLV